MRAVDTATHPAFQGRGIFSRLTQEALERIRPDAALIFNTPNEKSLPGYLKMGWKVAGRIPVWVRIAHPLRFARGAKGIRSGEVPVRPLPTPAAEPAAQVLSETRQLSDLVEESRLDRRMLSTGRDLQYLRWRYACAPSLDYRAIVHERGDQIRGLAIFRVRARGPLWEATVAELLVRPGDDRSARRLLRDIRSSVDADHVTSGFPPGSSPASRLPVGFVRSPMGPTFVVNVFDHGMEPDPSRLSSWALTLGDVEVF